MQFGKAVKQKTILARPSHKTPQKNLILLGTFGFAVILLFACSLLISSDMFANVIGKSTMQSSVDIAGIPSLKTVLIIGHLIGLMLGFGVAVFLDLYLLRYLFHRKITPEVIQTVLFGSKVVNAGLILLWITGLGFLWHYQVTSPDKLTNPKIWAKVTIVVLLTLNGAAIHFVILAKLRAKIGSALLTHEPLPVQLGLLFSGAISGVSWTMAMALGAIKEINHVVDASTLLGMYAALLAVAFLTLFAIANFISKRETPANNNQTPYSNATTPGLLA